MTRAQLIYRSGLWAISVDIVQPQVYRIGLNQLRQTEDVWGCTFGERGGKNTRGSINNEINC